MKHLSPKLSSKFAAIALSALLFTACNNAEKNNSNDPKDVAEEHNDAKFNKDKEKQAQFFVDVAEITMQEIKLSELAEKQAQAEDIKELGKILKEDHSKSLKEIEEMAAKKMITLPVDLSKDGKDTYDKLTKKQGADFDHAYADEMVDLHTDQISKFEKMSTDAEDYEIRTWTEKKLKELRTHLDRSMTCRDKYKEDKKSTAPLSKIKTKN
jgi:putative membrane protein